MTDKELWEIRLRYTVTASQFRDVGKWTLKDFLSLFRHIDSLRAEIEQLQKEKAALKSDLYDAAPCFACVNFKRNSGNCFGAGWCRYDKLVHSQYPNGWEWRGLEDDTK